MTRWQEFVTEVGWQRDNPLVVAVIVTHNSGTMISDCLNRLAQADYDRIESVVVDNGSKDRTPDRVSTEFPSCHLIRNADNKGFAYACNQGIRVALEWNADFILVLNDDAELEPETLSHLVEAAVGGDGQIIAVPTIVYHRTPDKVWFAYGSVVPWMAWFRNPAHGKKRHQLQTSPRHMIWAVGCAMLAPAEAFRRVGGFDASLWMYMEDVDWSLRARREGFQILLVPDAVALHHVSSTGNRYPKERRYLMSRNLVWTVRRHFGGGTLILVAALQPLRSLWRLVRLAASGQWAACASELRGAWHGFSRPLPARQISLEHIEEAP